MRQQYTQQEREESFWDKVGTGRDDGCWIWLGGLNNTGYGQFWNGKKTVTAHRYSWELHKGKTFKHLDLDHLCRNRRCVNPYHLEPVTNKENVLRGVGITANNSRKTHCHLGHPLSGDNLYVHNNQRKCKTCRREAGRRYEALYR